MHGQFVWYELTTPDVDASIRFYPKFTGWGTQSFGPDYTMWTTGGVPHAGIFRLTDQMKAQGVPPNWMPYVEVDDVDATASKAKSLGATIVAGPDDIPDTGRFAVVMDPQGAVLGIYKSVRESRAWDGNPVVGRFSWHELMTADHVKAAAFYSALFGWEKMGEMDMGGGQMYWLFGRGGAMYGGMYTTLPETAGMHPFWLVYINVKDVGKAVAAATRAGARVHRAQMDIPGGSIAILGDPAGAAFALHHVAAAPAAEAPSAKAPSSSPPKPPRSAKPKKKKKAAAAKAPARKAAKRSAKRAKPKAAASKAARRGAKRGKSKAPARKAKRSSPSRPARKRSRPARGKAKATRTATRRRARAKK